MAIFKALTFDGVNSLDYGIYITGEAVYNAPERAVEMVNIPGKNGALALDQGRFENIEVTYHAGCFADNQADFADKVMKFRNALASRYTYKRLTDEYHPDEYRLGLYKSGLDVDAVRYGTAGEFNIVFDCKPQRFLIDGDRAISPTEWSDLQTESGELVTIESDGSLGVKSLEVSLEPIQDLNGYDKPWSGGNGKNKFDASHDFVKVENGMTFTLNNDGSVTANGTATPRCQCYWKIPKETAQTLGGLKISCGRTHRLACLLELAGPPYTQYANINTDDGLVADTISSISTDAHFIIRIFTGTTFNNVKLCPMIRTASTDATWQPYSNICPISGHTEVDVVRTGVNVWDEEWESGKYDASGAKASDSLKIRSKNYIGVAPSTSYYFENTASNGFHLCFYDANKTFISEVGLNGDTSFTTPNNAHYMTFNSYNAYGTTYNNDISINYPSTDHDYHAYDGTTYTTALGRTVYGGTLDVVSGKLTADRVKETYEWSNGTGATTLGDYTRKVFKTTYASVRQISGDNIQICDCLPWKHSYSDQSAHFYVDTGNAGSNNCVVFMPNSVTSQTLNIVYELATPQTYQLTPQQIELLVGENHLWSDGEITLTYGVHPYYNPTPFESKPLIKVTGTGTLGIGEYILTITGTASQTLYIDCETMEIYTLEGTVPTGASSRVSINKNDFPVLEPGTNYISVGSGITAVTITPRWWRI